MLYAHLCSVLEQPQAPYSLVKRQQEAQKEPLTNMHILLSFFNSVFVLSLLLVPPRGQLSFMLTAVNN